MTTFFVNFVVILYYKYNLKLFKVKYEQMYNKKNSVKLSPEIIKSINRIINESALIRCFSSYHRKCVHDYAENCGLSHRSIIDYTNFHVTQNIQRSGTHCTDEYCDCCINLEIMLSCKPFSYVEIGCGYQDEIVGNKYATPQKLIVTKNGWRGLKTFIKKERKKYAARVNNNYETIMHKFSLFREHARIILSNDILLDIGVIIQHNTIKCHAQCVNSNFKNEYYTRI